MEPESGRCGEEREEEEGVDAEEEEEATVQGTTASVFAMVGEAAENTASSCPMSLSSTSMSMYLVITLLKRVNVALAILWNSGEVASGCCTHEEYPITVTSLCNATSGWGMRLWTIMALRENNKDECA